MTEDFSLLPSTALFPAKSEPLVLFWQLTLLIAPGSLPRSEMIRGANRKVGKRGMKDWPRFASRSSSPVSSEGGAAALVGICTAQCLMRRIT